MELAPEKRKLKIFSQLKKLQADVVYYKRLIDLPQLQISLKQLSFLMCSQPAITLGKGGSNLIHKNVNFTVLNTVIDPEGRFLIIKLSIFDKKLCIVSIYGPNVDDPLFLPRLFYRTL